MDASLDAYLELAAAFIQPELISPEALDHIMRIAAFLPPVTASGFECRLGDATARADLGCRFWPPERGPQYLAGMNEGDDNLPAFLLQAPPWRRIQAFAARWAQPGTLLHQDIEDIFLEFDVDGVPPDVPIPAIFLDFYKDSSNPVPALREALALLWGEAVTPEVERQVLRCVDALPDGAVLYSLGAMFSRGLQGVRLYLNHMPSHEIPAYLQRVGWPGSVATIADLVSWMPPDLMLCVDVSTILIPRVGVQYHVVGDPDHSTPTWLEFLDVLVARGLCLPEKRDALENWLGHVHERSHRDKWPANLRTLSQQYGPSVMSMFVRMINHIKVSYQPGEPLEAKAYLAMVQTWLRFHPQERRFVFGDPPIALQSRVQGH